MKDRPPNSALRVVFDTTTVISALLFQGGQLAWLRDFWARKACTPLVSRETALELTRVLAYPKFRLAVEDQQELLAGYLPCCEIVKVLGGCAVRCRDVKDQPFLDLAQSGRADVLVSGDQDLLALANETSFVIESPSEFRRRLG